MKLGFFAILASFGFTLAFFNSHIANADSAPECMARGQVVTVNNSQVAKWKVSTPDQFRSRAHVTGVVSRLFSNETGHLHFEVTLDGTNATLEIIYNQEFGTVNPPVQVGVRVESCGDYISAPADGHEPSPDGAILHWVHRSPDPQRHDDGFVLINGVLYGQDVQAAGNRYN